jgi:hypothetical protein
MYSEECYIVFPEGDMQEVPGRLHINQLVDINGFPVPLPLSTNKTLVYRISQITRKEHRGGCDIYHYLEQLSADELSEYVRF